MRVAKLLGAATVIFFLAAGNFRQVGLSQRQIPPVRTLGFGDVASVVFSPDGRYLAVGTWGGSSVQLIDTSSWQVIRTFEGHTSGVNSVAFSPDGRILASGSCGRFRLGKGCDQGEIKLWEVATGSEVRTLEGPTWNVPSVAFSPDGRFLAFGSCGGHRFGDCVRGDITLWDVASGREVRTLTLKGHTSDVNSVAFSPDGKLLASVSSDGTIKLWNVAGKSAPSKAALGVFSP